MTQFLFVPLPHETASVSTDSVFSTWYDFRSLDLHEALVDEGVSEELAHSWLQPENCLAGGRLEEEA